MRRENHLSSLQQKEEEMRQKFVIRVKEKEAELKEAEKEVRISRNFSVKFKFHELFFQYLVRKRSRSETTKITCEMNHSISRSFKILDAFIIGIKLSTSSKVTSTYFFNAIEHVYMVFHMIPKI